MPYSLQRLGKLFYPGLSALLLTAHANAASSPIFFHSRTSSAHILNTYALYDPKGDTLLGSPPTGYIRRDRDGSLVIAIPKNALGKCRVRFFDQGKTLLFEIRQIMDPLLIVEKYNFRHAGLFAYELYRDNVLIERNNFEIVVP
jgi:hypothetical protein